MLSQVLTGLRVSGGAIRHHVTRNIGVTAPAMAKAAQNLDPIQKLFHEKLLQYTEKSKKAGGLVDSSPEQEKQLTDELAKIDRMYGGGKGTDMTAFPTFSFSDPALEQVDIGLNRAEAAQEFAAKSVAKEETAADKEDYSDTPWFSL